MVCSAPHACYFACLQIKFESIHSTQRKQRSLSPSAVPLSTKHFLREELQVLIQVHLIVTVHRNLWTFNPATSYHQGLFRWNQDGLRWYLPCSPRMVVSDVDLWLGRYLNSDITRFWELWWQYLTLHCCFTKTTRNSLGFSQSTPPRLAGDSCPHQTLAAIKPTSTLQLQLSSEHYWAEGIPSVISPFPVHHPTAQALWRPSLTLSGIECWVTSSQGVLLYR